MLTVTNVPDCSSGPQSWINRSSLKKAQGSVAAEELTPDIPSKAQEHLPRKEEHVASAP